jgi:L-galactose dehydrogenase/L-glyceraldehyde 3-phosphate reductase
MDRLRDQGMIRFAGTTRQAIESGRFQSAQIYYNLLNPSVGQAVPDGWSGHDFSGLIMAYKESGVAAMSIRIFAAGVITTDIRHGRETVLTQGSEIPDEEMRTRKVFDVLDTEFGSRAQTAERFGLANEDLACVLVGLADMDQLDEALAATDLGPLPDAALRRLEPLHANDFA